MGKHHMIDNVALQDFSVSVAMAVFNGSRFLDEQIKSILVQMRPDDELIISYDPSSDSTYEIITQYSTKDSRVKVFDNNNPGIFGNFTNSILHCSNRIIFISDQDDIWVKSKRDTIVAEFLKNKSDLIIHDGYNINSSGERISENFFRMYKVKKGIVRNFIKSRYSGCCMAFDKNACDWILPFPDDIDCYDRWIELICEICGKVDFVNKVLIKHRMHENNATSKEKRSIIEISISRIRLLKNLIYRYREKM